MSNRKEIKEKWRNIVTYISASLEQQEYAPTRKESEDLNEEMYNWLMNNFKLVRKYKKQSIFDLNKPQP